MCSHRPALELRASAVSALRALGIKAIDSSGASLFEAQRACWPVVDAGLPAFLAAPTGTGKSVLAVLRACTVAGMREEGTTTTHPTGDLALPRALVIAPTRELAAQHLNVARTILSHTAPGAHAALIAGGEKHAAQRRSLAALSPALVVGTPGRVLAHVAQTHLSLHRVRCVVLDEADILLSPDGGFWLELRQLLQLLHATPAGRKDAKDEAAHEAARVAASAEAGAGVATQPLAQHAHVVSKAPVPADAGVLRDSAALEAEASDARASADVATAEPPRAPRARARRPPRIQLLLTAATADTHTLQRAALIAPRLQLPSAPNSSAGAAPRPGAPLQLAAPPSVPASLMGTASHSSVESLPATVRHEWRKLLRPGDSKLRALNEHLKAGCAPTLVFTNTMASCMAAWRSLWERGLDAARLHGGMEPAERDSALAKLRSGAACVLVTTDVAMRGLDLPSIVRVINFDFPESAQQFVHRVGRTGRAGAKGTAVHLLGSHGEWVLARQLRDPVQLRALLAAGPPVPAEPSDDEPRHSAPSAREHARPYDEPDAARGLRKRAPAGRGATRLASAEAAALASLEAEDAEYYDESDGADERGEGRSSRARAGDEQRAPAAVGGSYALRGEAGRGRIVLRTRGRRLSEDEAAREHARGGSAPLGRTSEPLHFVRSAYTPSLRSARSKQAGVRGAPLARPAEDEYDEERVVEFGDRGEALMRVRRTRRFPRADGKL